MFSNQQNQGNIFNNKGNQQANNIFAQNQNQGMNIYIKEATTCSIKTKAITCSIKTKVTTTCSIKTRAT